MINIKVNYDGKGTMTKAKVNGISCIVYDYEMESGATYCACYFPELGYKMPVLATLIEVEYERI